MFFFHIRHFYGFDMKGRGGEETNCFALNKKGLPLILKKTANFPRLLFLMFNEICCYCFTSLDFFYFLYFIFLSKCKTFNQLGLPL